ncbi:MAG: Rne/Rng family ribonuclease [Fibrobacterota bacterium]
MEREIIINVAPHEKRIAILEDQKLVRIIVERPESRRLLGNIYKGRVENVLPGLQSVFVNIGLEKAAFMNISDVKENYLPLAEETGELEEAPAQANRFLRVEHLFKKGQEVLVQVIKEPLSTKGARITNSLSIPGRFLVMLPGIEFIGVSKKTRDHVERKRLRKLISELKPPGMGFIVRTVAFTKTEQEFRAEFSDLHDKWLAVKLAAEKKGAPTLLYQEESLSDAAIRDLFSRQVSRLIVDSKEEYKDIVNYIKARNPELLDRIYHFTEKAPIFEVFGIEKEVERSLRRKVWLKSGGYLIFDYTEAMVVIDVNTGRNVGKRSVEDTLLRTNLEAAEEIARQLRLRELGGLIAVDFIDMRGQDNQRKLQEEFHRHLKRDTVPFNMGRINEFGIIMVTRKREGESLVASFSEICEGCGGTGRIFSKETVITKIDRLMDKIRHILEIKKVILVVNPGFAQYLMENDKKIYKEIQRAADIKIVIEEDRHMALDSFRIYDMDREKEFTSILTQ